MLTFMPESSAPTVEMLWESTEPSVALRERFGFDDGQQLADWLTTTLDDHWGLAVISVDRVLISAANAVAWIRTDQGPLVAKWSIVTDLFPRLAELARLTDWLDRRGLPVSAPRPATDGSLHLETDRVSLGLQSVINGDFLDPDDLDQVTDAGVQLARFQTALADYPDVDRIVAASGQTDPPGLREVVATALERMSEPQLQAGGGVLRERLATLPDPDELHWQLVHNDFRAANVLYSSEGLLAVLDIEEARVAPRVAELAKACVLLGTQFRNWAPITPATRAAFLAGYRSVHALSPAEEEWLAALTLLTTVSIVSSHHDSAGWDHSARALAEAFRSTD